MKLRTIKQIKNLKNKRVLVRVDFNVPMDKNKIKDENRILASIPTIEYLLKKKAKVILVSHLGRPKGIDKKLSLEPIAKKLAELLESEVFFTDLKNIQAVAQLPKLTLLENIRFYSGEEKNDTKFSKELASLGDIFILDGFAVVHREAASVSGVAKYLPSYAGLLLGKEIVGLNKAIQKPKKPFVVVLGGAKMETKVPVLKNLLPKADYVLIGGGIFNTYLKASGYKIGSSLVDNDYLKDALKYCKAMKVIKPIDVVVGSENSKNYEVVKINSKLKIQNSKLAVYDIGPATIRLYAEYIKKAKTLVWNGAMGYFEQRVYSTGTLSVARLVASRARGPAFGIIGGGETLEAMEKVKMTEFVDLISTGGGSMLEYLAGQKLPGLRALIS